MGQRQMKSVAGTVCNVVAAFVLVMPKELLQKVLVVIIGAKIS